MDKLDVPVTTGSPNFRAIDTERLRVTVATFPAGLRLAMHTHAEAILAVMLGGGFELSFEDRRYDCPPGTICIEPAQVPHANQLGSRAARVLVLEIPPDAGWIELGSLARAFHDPASFRREDVFRLAQSLTREVSADMTVSPLAIAARAAELLAAAGGATQRDTDRRPRAHWLRHVRDRLHASLDRPLLLADLAREAGVHRVHLGRVFRAAYGESLGAYHRRLRIEWAAQELLKPHAHIGDIAARAGFADQSHFTRCFRRRMGETPHAWATRRGRRLP